MDNGYRLHQITFTARYSKPRSYPALKIRFLSQEPHVTATKAYLKVRFEWKKWVADREINKYIKKYTQGILDLIKKGACPQISTPKVGAF